MVLFVVAAFLLIGTDVCRRNWIVSMPCAAIGAVLLVQGIDEGGGLRYALSLVGRGAGVDI